MRLMPIRRSALVADLIQNVSHTRGLGDADLLDEKTKRRIDRLAIDRTGTESKP